jgi:putative ABC transport system substrate-binding protein
MAIESQKEFDTVLNQSTINLFGLKVPQDILQKAVLVK